jgi:transposase
MRSRPASFTFLPNRPSRAGLRCNQKSDPFALFGQSRRASGGSKAEKEYRRITTRYDKLAASYLAFVQLAAIRIWL